MRITKIEEQKNNKKRCSIYIDGEYHSSIDKEILDEMNLYEGMELDEDGFNEKMETIKYKSALRASLYILAHSSKTEKEIGIRLREMRHSEDAITKVLEYLKEIGYINDESYTESFIRTMKDNTGISRRSLYSKLAGKGVDSEVILQKLEEADIDDYASALKAARKKLPGLKGSDSEKASKLMGYLYRKGYGADICRKVVEELQLDEA